MEALEKFSKVRVLVVGDVMLDQYWWGSVNRISPEAPVPIVRLDRTTIDAGGAANVAANISGLGAEACLVGVTGSDAEAGMFPEVLSRSNVSAAYLVKSKNRPTTIKTRVVAHSQQVVRIDQETNINLDPREEAQVWDQAKALLDQTDVVLISDYGKGILTNDLLSRLITTSRHSGKIVLVDPKGKDYGKYKGATLLTPNKKEAAEACGLDEDIPDVVLKAGAQLVRELELEALLITQGEDGMTLFQKGIEPLHHSSLARAVYDVTGAGDTVIATLAVALAAGAGLAAASKLANIAAGLVVEEVGTTTIKFEDLKKAFEADG